MSCGRRRPYGPSREEGDRLSAVVGGILVVAGQLVILMGWGGMDERVPTQVPPRRFAGYAFAAGALLLAVAAVALAVPGG
jgi:hypothetical protein